MKVYFKVKTKGVQSEHALNVNTTAKIGRSRHCNILLEDVKVSGQHCIFLLKKDKLELTDNNSKNGTYLNGIRIEQSEVFIGDQVRVGDTLITIEESKMEADSINVLTFPGPKTDRADYALKADFTGARIANQQYHQRIQRAEEAHSHDREVFYRKKAQSKIRLSKQEIRAHHKIRSLISTVIDGCVICFCFFFPVMIFSKKLAPAFLLSSGVLAAFACFYVTYKVMKFTLGEQLTGIQDLYKKQ